MTHVQRPINLTSPLAPELIRAVLADPNQRRLIPWLYSRVKRDPTGLPDRVLGELRKFYLASLRRNLVLDDELLTLLSVFENNGLPVLPLKGTLLAQRLYGDLALRPCADIDLFVRHEDVAHATGVLERAGYLWSENERGQYELTLCRSRDVAFPLHVGLHWGFFGYFAESAAELPAAIWSRARPCSEGGVRHYRMDLADEVLYLCVHLYKHHFQDPLLALDIRLLLDQKQSAIDWPALAERARRFNLRLVLAASMAFSEHWFGAAAQDVRPSPLRLPRWLQMYFEQVEWRGKLEPVWQRLPLSAHFRLLFHLLLLSDTWRDRLSHVHRSLRWLCRVPSQGRQARANEPG